MASEIKNISDGLTKIIYTTLADQEYEFSQRVMMNVAGSMIVAIVVRGGDPEMVANILVDAVNQGVTINNNPDDAPDHIRVENKLPVKN